VGSAPPVSPPPPSERRRCPWAEANSLLLTYHDEEWGVPDRDSRRLWEKLMLDGFQAGLSWLVVLRKRDALRRGLRNFEPERVARMSQADVARLLKDPAVVRSRAKVEATIAGARAFLAMRARGEEFSDFVWGIAGGSPIQNRGPIPTRSPLSERLSDLLRERGFRFVGPTIVYAWMQAVGIVNDHARGCFRRPEVAALAAGRP
jgi:DNA-3-methyladenine glycosylase I